LVALVSFSRDLEEQLASDALTEGQLRKVLNHFFDDHGSAGDPATSSPSQARYVAWKSELIDHIKVIVAAWREETGRTDLLIILLCTARAPRIVDIEPLFLPDVHSARERRRMERLARRALRQWLAYKKRPELRRSQFQFMSSYYFPISAGQLQDFDPAEHDLGQRLSVWAPKLAAMYDELDLRAPDEVPVVPPLVLARWILRVL
jgi:hypothetical protein